MADRGSWLQISYPKFLLRLRRPGAGIEMIENAIRARLTPVAPTVTIRTKNEGDTITTTIVQRQERSYFFGILVIHWTVRTSIGETTDSE